MAVELHLVAVEVAEEKSRFSISLIKHRGFISHASPFHYEMKRAESEVINQSVIRTQKDPSPLSISDVFSYRLSSLSENKKTQMSLEIDSFFLSSIDWMETLSTNTTIQQRVSFACVYLEAFI